MGSSGSQKSTTSLPGFSLPYAKEGLKGAFNYYLPGGQPGPYGGPEQNVAPLTADQYAAFQQAGHLAGTGPGSVSSAYAPYTPDAQNPYVDQLVHKGQQDLIAQFQDTVAPNIMNRAAQTGTLGSAGNWQAMHNADTALATGLGDVETGIRGQEFDTTMNRGLQAAQGQIGGQLAANQALGQAGGQEQQQGQNVLDTAYANQNRAFQWPQQAYDKLAGLLGGFTGNQSTTKVTGGSK